MKLVVDGQDIRLNSFVLRITTNIMECMIRSLDDIPENPKKIVFAVGGTSGAEILLDGQRVRMNVFVRKIVGNVIQGIVHSLDDVPVPPGRIEIFL